MFKEMFSNGRAAAIFFLIVSASYPKVMASEIYGKVDSVISRGLLTDNYWQQQKLDTSSKKVLAYTDVKVGASTTLLNREIFLERRKIATLSTNSNSLLAASNANNGINSETYGNFPLSAHLRKFEFDAVGIVFDDESNGDGFSWSIAPKLLRLNSFTTGEGQGELQLTPTSQRLTGNIERHGMSSYGFTVSPTPMQIGIGGSVDLDMTWRRSEFKFNLSSVNLLSRISSSGAYFNERTYQISTQSGNLVFSKTPSLTGTYGQENRILHLPRIIKSTVSQENSDSNWSKHFGVISLEDGHIPWAGVGYTQGNSAIKIATYALNNIFVSYEKRNFLIANLGFEITIGTALQGKNQITLTSLQYIF